MTPILSKEVVSMIDRGRLSLVVGAFVLASGIALAITILSLSSQQGVFVDRYRVVGYFENVSGLIPNAPVWLAGTQVGRVESVDLDVRASGAPAVRVGLQIDTAVRDRIRADSAASIGTIGLLGDRYVEISLGTSDEPPLAEGAEIRTVSPTNLNRVIETGAVALDNISQLAGNLNEVVARFQSESGGKGLADSVSAVAGIVTQIQDGSGLLHSLIYDEYEGSGVASIERSLSTFQNILDEVASGEGLLHSLVYEPLTEQDVVLEALDAGSRLNSILAKIDRGEGTIGLLLNDPTLYEDLKLLIGGAQRSAVVRTLIRMTAEDGESEP
jgi:phospholipid/cholesterol/gamma-HCH transport system substrate-binding protein